MNEKKSIVKIFLSLLLLKWRLRKERHWKVTYTVHTPLTFLLWIIFSSGLCHRILVTGATFVELWKFKTWPRGDRVGGIPSKSRLKCYCMILHSKGLGRTRNNRSLKMFHQRRGSKRQIAKISFLKNLSFYLACVGSTID